MTDQETKELREIITRIFTHQDAAGLSDVQFVSRVRDGSGRLLLGSDRTWERLRTEDWAELRLEKWTKRLREAASLLDSGTPPESLSTDIPFFRLCNRRLAALDGQQNDRRCMVVLALSGVGKSFFARWACDPARGPAAANRKYFRCTPSMRNKGSNICAGLAQRLLPGESLGTGYQRLSDAITRYLKGTPTTLFIDEAHEGGLELLKLIRAWIDETPVRVVYLAYPTEWDAVIGADTGAMAEGRQFVRRTMKPIVDDYRFGTKPADVAALLRARTELEEAAAKALAAELCDTLTSAENLSTLDDALAEAAREADFSESKITAELIRRKVAVCASDYRRVRK